MSHTGETPSRSTEEQRNSQQHPSVYKYRRPKSIEDTEKTDGKGIASGQKGPWDQHRDQGDCSPKPDSWERAELVVPSPAKQGLSSTERDLIALSHREGKRDKVVNPRRLWALAGES